VRLGAEGRHDIDMVWREGVGWSSLPGGYGTISPALV
jgi:hypothetical protein